MSAVSVTEQTISAALRRLAPEQWPQVLAFIDSLTEGASPRLELALISVGTLRNYANSPQ